MSKIKTNSNVAWGDRDRLCLETVIEEKAHDRFGYRPSLVALQFVKCPFSKDARIFFQFATQKEGRSVALPSDLADLTSETTKFFCRMMGEISRKLQTKVEWEGNSVFQDGGMKILRFRLRNGKSFSEDAIAIAFLVNQLLILPSHQSDWLGKGRVFDEPWVRLEGEELVTYFEYLYEKEREAQALI